MIKFVGDWKKLIPMGYKFQRLFASNYICYHKHNEIWIWKARKDLEICDLYDDSCYLLNYLISINFDPLSNTRLILNRVDKIIEEHNFYKHEVIHAYMNMNHHELTQFINTGELQFINTDKFKEFNKNLNNNYREIFITNQTIQSLKELYDNKLIIIEI